MKKLVTAFAACMLASLVSATDGVYSQNIVGYSTSSLTANGFNMIGINFEAVGGGTNDLNATMSQSGLAGISDWENFAGGDQLLVWDPSAQYYPVFYTWTGPNAETLGGTEAGTNNKWVNLITWDGTVAGLPVIKIPTGGGVWIVRTTTGVSSVTFAGQVQTTASTISLTGNGFNMFANAKPISINVNDSAAITFTGLQGVSDWENFAGGDQLMIWNPASQYYPVFYTWTGPNAESLGGTEVGTNNKWVDLITWDGTVAGLPVITIPVNGAAWLVRTTAGSASINVPAL